MIVDDDRQDPLVETNTGEDDRLNALQRYDILDTRPEDAFDRLTDLAADFFQVPVAFIAFLDANRQWFKSKVGLDQNESTLAESFCTYTVESEDLLVIEDTLEEGRTASSPFVTEDGFRFYAGAPLVTPDGHAIGTFSIMDREPRSLKENQIRRLWTFANMATAELENRRKSHQHKQVARRFEAILDDPNILAGVLSPEGTLLEANDTALQYVNEEEDQVLGEPFWESPWWPPRLQADVRSWVERAAAGEYVEYAADLTTPEEVPFSVEGVIRPVIDENGTVSALIVSARDVTARKEREERLQETTARLEALFEASPDMINVHDTKGNIITPNSRLLDETGYSADELTAMKIWELDEKIDKEHAQKLWTEMDVGDQERLEGEYRRRDGSTFPVEVHIRRLDLEGEDRFLAITRDITKQKDREAALRRQRNLLEQTQRLAGAWEIDLQTEEMSWSKKIYEIHEVAPDTDVSIEDAIQFYAPEVQSKIREAYERCTEEGKPYDLELPLITANGNRRWVRTVGAPVEVENGDVIKVAGAFQDITERQEREDQLHGRHQKIESLYDATKRLLTADDVKTVSDRIHDVLQDVFDYDLNNTAFVEGEVIVPEMTTMNESLEVPHPTTQPLDGNSLSAKALRAGETVVINNLNDLDNEVNYGRLQLAAAVPIGTRGVIIIGQMNTGSFDPFDVRLIEVLGTYASLVLDRLHREDTLRQAKKEAEEASQLKSAMLANMSHEIRTPLTSVTGFAEMLKNTLEGEQRQFARRIYGSGQRLMKTLDSVLELSRLEASSDELERDDVSLSEVVRTCLEMTRPSAKESGVTIQTDLSAGSVEGAWNRGAIRHIVENLLDNAIKFTPQGGGVEVRVFEDADDAVLTVKDTGIGIREEVQSEIFEAFKQESEGLTREYEGSGLGLSIVKRLTEAHQGTITVESEKGAGSLFTVRLPKRTHTKQDVSFEPSTRSKQGTHRDANRMEPSIFQRMYRITADKEASFDDKTTRLIDLGREYLGLPYGFLTRISDGTQTIVHSSGDHPLLVPESTCPLSDAYCRKTLQQESLLTVHDAPGTGWKGDPAYERFQLGSYVGSKVWIGDELYGTICFAASEPRNTPFSMKEKTFVELLTRWVSYELEQRRDQRRVKSQNEQLEKFASVVSHDLRNPLNVAQGRLSLALETMESDSQPDGSTSSKEASDEPVESHLEAVRGALDRMQALIADVLALTWSEQNFDAENLSVLALSELSKTSWAQVRTGKATLTVDDDIKIRAHEGRLQQLLENLFRNAVEHGGDEVTVNVGSLPTGFFVEDDGPGISEGIRDKIFERGYSSTDHGTGLGLPIAKAIAEAHGWTLSVTDGEKGGARFELHGVDPLSE